MRHFFLPLALALAACPDPGRAPTAPRPDGPPGLSPSQAAGKSGSLDPSTVVATVGGETVTLAALDEDIAAELAEAEQEYQKKIFETRQAGLERYVIRQVLELEAKARGLADEDALIEQEVEQKAEAPTEAEILAFYEETKSDPRLQGVPFEAVQPRIVAYLGQEKKKKRFDALVVELKAKHAATIDLPVPRVEVAATGFAKGPESAPVTIVTFSDFECPYCSRAVPVLHQIDTVYKDKVRVVFRDYPLPFHPNAVKAAEAARCAGVQGKFWEMHDALFENQRALAVEDLKRHAGGIEGLDTAAFATCLDGGEMKAKVDADLAAGRAAGVSGTPAFFVNGIPISGAQPFESFKEIIDRELERAAKKGG